MLFVKFPQVTLWAPAGLRESGWDGSHCLSENKLNKLTIINSKLKGMNRKLVNGLLLLTVATGGVGTFTSCKDTESDFRSQVLVAQVDLSEQIAALRNITDPAFKQNLDNLINGLIAAGDFATNTDLQKVVNDLLLLSSRVDGLESEIDVISGKLDNFATKDELNTVKDQLTVMLETAVSELNQTIAGINTRLDGLDTLVGNLQGDITNLQTELGNITTKLSTIEQNIATLTQDVADAKAKAAEALAKAIANENAISTLNTKVGELEQKFNDYYTKGEIDGFKTELENKITALNTALDALGTELRGAINNVETALGLAKGRLDAIEEFNNKVEKQFSFLWDKLARLITSIQLQRVVNPIFGGLDFPIGFSTSVLANYLYNGVNDVTFPNDDSKLEYGQTDYAKNLYENLNLAAIGAPSEFIKGNTMTLGSLGDVYVTLNPTANDFTGVRAKLVNSLDQTILEDLVLEKDNETLFKFGFTRAAGERSGNGLHRATVKATDVEKAVSQIGLEVEPGLLEAFKDAIKNRTRQDFAELAKLLVQQFNNKFDAYALKVSWDDVDQEGNKFENSVISGYDIAATTFRPLSYRSGFGFTVDNKLHEFSPLTEYFNNYFDELSKKIKFEFKDLGGFEHILIELDKVDTTVTMEGDIVIDLSGLPVYEVGYENDPDHIIGVLGEDAKITLSQNGAEGVGSGDLAPLIDAIQQAVDNSQAQVDDIKDQLTTQVNDMIDEINRQLEGLQGQINDQIGNILDEIREEISGKLSHFNRFVDLYNKIARKINQILEDPNGYLQVMAFYANANGPHHLSTKVTAPTVFNAEGGNAIDIFCTSYNAELIVPSYKKYVAITGVYDSKGNKVNADLRALNENNGSMNKIATGNQHRFAINADKLEAGKIYEVLYQALDYRGYTSTRAYYITVKK